MQQNDPAIEAAAKHIYDKQRYDGPFVATWEQLNPSARDAFVSVVKEIVEVFLANSTAETIVDTRAGLALANDAYTAGVNAGIKAANDWVLTRPVSPYSAPLAELIKAEQ